MLTTTSGVDDCTVGSYRYCIEKKTIFILIIFIRVYCECFRFDRYHPACCTSVLRHGRSSYRRDVEDDDLATEVQTTVVSSYLKINRSHENRSVPIGAIDDIFHQFCPEIPR